MRLAFQLETKEKFRKKVFLLIAMTTLIKCSPKMGLDTDSMRDNYTDGHLNAIADTGFGKNLEARQEFEEKTITLFTKEGI